MQPIRDRKWKYSRDRTGIGCVSLLSVLFESLCSFFVLSSVGWLLSPGPVKKSTRPETYGRHSFGMRQRFTGFPIAVERNEVFIRYENRQRHIQLWSQQIESQRKHCFFRGKTKRSRVHYWLGRSEQTDAFTDASTKGSPENFSESTLSGEIDLAWRYMSNTITNVYINGWKELRLSLIHIWRCRRSYACRSRWSPYH